ncbi:hypothetical protein PSTG_04415 [Puccinia striiformis f. sp. tritici PST-78]|uniref:Secreted protein n=1 Tax=Puccinia striiformis f. sp. tritici PST-78 TaxID=1165861 RepID=A0A0L0VTB4_9BASI|nr:hypothetical protein PSTG_04415 [Puccinia striiformis f. sp. tritici PST-78]
MQSIINLTGFFIALAFLAQDQMAINIPSQDASFISIPSHHMNFANDPVFHRFSPHLSQVSRILDPIQRELPNHLSQEL